MPTKSSAYTPEVFTLVDRVAAAFMRNEISYARELVNEARLQWESDGRREEKRERRSMADVEMFSLREGNCWFHTKDGLRSKERMINSTRFPGFPPEWKRPCTSTISALVSDAEDLNSHHREIRTYFLSRYGPDGLPIYTES